MRILIIGGYGAFGGRLVDLLLDEPRLTLIVAGRDPASAERFCETRREQPAKLLFAKFDRANPDAALASLHPDLIVDAAGPFQLYGPDPYKAVRSALGAGASWIDLADGLDFVRDISALDAEARAAGKFVLSGASSFPVLTASVVRRLRAMVPRIESIVAGIAPSPFAVVGLNVVRAIASYAGKPVRVRHDGRWDTLYGLISSRTMTVAPEGHAPLPPTRFALVEVPDLAVLADDWPEAQTVWMGAGPTPALLHRLLWLAAWTVRLRLLPTLVPFAPLMNWAVNTFRWGRHQGGMIVTVAGGGQQASWHMIAEGDVGPYIPSMAIEAIIRKCLDGHPPLVGARPAHHELELSDYEAMFARRGIVTSTHPG